MTVRTLINFAHQARVDFFTSNPDADVTRAEYDRIYPRESRLDEWVQSIRDAARAGETIPAVVLDDLYRRTRPHCFWSLHHDYPNSFPAGYLNPEAREREAAEREAWREARRVGRKRGAA